MVAEPVASMVVVVRAGIGNGSSVRRLQPDLRTSSTTSTSALQSGELPVGIDSCRYASTADRAAGLVQSHIGRVRVAVHRSGGGTVGRRQGGAIGKRRHRLPTQVARRDVGDRGDQRAAGTARTPRSRP